VNIVVEGISFDVEYGYQPKEAATATYPGCEESVSIESVRVSSTCDIQDSLSDYCIGLIKEAIMEQM